MCLWGRTEGRAGAMAPNPSPVLGRGMRGVVLGYTRVVSSDEFKEERQTGFPFPPEISPPSFFFQTEAKFHLFKLIIWVLSSKSLINTLPFLVITNQCASMDDWDLFFYHSLSLTTYKQALHPLILLCSQHRSIVYIIINDYDVI